MPVGAAPMVTESASPSGFVAVALMAKIKSVIIFIFATCLFSLACVGRLQYSLDKSLFDWDASRST